MAESTTFRELVKFSKLAQHDIGKMLGRSRKTINQWCKGEAPAWAIELLTFKLKGSHIVK